MGKQRQLIYGISQAPSGTMNFDDDVHALNQGDYPDGFAIRHLSDKSGNSISVEDIIGNKLAFGITPVLKQFKTYRILVDTSTSLSYQIQVYDPNGNILNTWNFSTVAGDIALSINNLMGQITGVYQKTAHYAESYVEVSVPSYGYDFLLFSSGVNEIKFQIEKEAIDASLAGNMQPIAGYYVNDYSFIWSTTRRSMPVDLPAVLSVTPIGTAIGINFASAHNLAVDELISLQGFTSINGNWVVTVINATTVQLQNSSFVVQPTIGKAVQYSSGIGEIGVGYKDPNTQVWIYKTLIRATQLNFRTPKKPKIKIEPNDLQYNLYWTDDYNSPRVMYYIGSPFQTDGFLTLFNAAALYYYDTLNKSIQMFLNNLDGFDFKFISQQQSGGGVKAGNWRYAIRFLTESLVATPWTDLSNIVITYNYDTGLPLTIGGSPAGEASSKINNMQMTGIPFELFKFAELAGINYANGAITGLTIRRDLLNGTSVQQIQHTGNESGSLDLDIATLNQRYAGIKTCVTLDILDQRMTYSNITTQAETDFGAWTKSWKHRILRKSLNAVRSPEQGNYQLGEYADPNNVYNYMGYMHNEIYRLSAKFELYDGSITPNFWWDDIRIDTLGNNLIANPTDNRRVPGGGLTNYDLTDAGADHVYAAYLEPSGIDFNFSIDGIPVRQLVKRILFEVQEITPALRDVLGCGVMIKAAGNEVGNNGDNTPTIYQHPVFGSSNLYSISPFDLTGIPTSASFPGTPTKFFEFYGASLWSWAPGETYNINLHSRWYNYSFAYIPDALYGNMQTPSLRPSDLVYNYGSPTRYFSSQVSLISPGAVLLPSEYAEYNGRCGLVDSQVQKVTLGSIWDMPFGSSVVDGGNTFSKTSFYCRADLVGFLFKWNYSYQENNPAGALMKSSSSTLNGASYSNNFIDVNAVGNPDFGLHYFQYIRPHGSGIQKYGVPEGSKYVPTGTFYEVSQASPTIIGQGIISVFGGDTFTQKTYIKNRIPQQAPNTSASPNNDAGFTLVGGGSGIGFYSQNRVNAQMRKNDNSTFNNWQFPRVTAPAWIEALATSQQNPLYNKGYNAENGVSVDTAFDPNKRQSTRQAATLYYSLLKVSGSLVDNYRYVLPGNSKSWDLANGEVTHHAVANQELYVWQENNFSREFFNTSGILQSLDSAQIMIAEEGVLRNKGRSITSFGCKHRHGIGKGISQTGDDIFMWYCANSKEFIRFGMNGTTPLAIVKKMRTFFKNNTTWAFYKDTPSAGEGITMIWDEGNKEMIATFRAHKNTPVWSADPFLIYQVGQSVHLAVQPPGTYSTFEETVEIYECIQQHFTSAATMPETGATWQQCWRKVLHTDPDYFNEFSVVFSEAKMGFTAFYPFKPMVYIPYSDSFLSGRPTGRLGLVYEHNKGELLTWYTDGNSEQAVDGYVEMPINHLPDINKDYSAVWINCLNPPSGTVHAAEYRTKRQFTYADDSNFEDKKDCYTGELRNDATVTPTNPNGRNDLYTSPINGTYLLVKFFFKNRTYNKLLNFVARVSNRPRINNT